MSKPIIIIVPEHKHLVCLPEAWGNNQPLITRFVQQYESFMASEKKKALFVVGTGIEIQLMQPGSYDDDTKD